MARRLYHAILGMVAGVLLSVWIVPFVAAFYDVTAQNVWTRIWVGCLTFGGVVGLLFGLTKGAKEVKGQSRWGGLRVLFGGACGVVCGVALSFVGYLVEPGSIKSLAVTIPLGFFLGTIAGWASAYNMRAHDAKPRCENRNDGPPA